jgi:hypothetical protein
MISIFRNPNEKKKEEPINKYLHGGTGPKLISEKIPDRIIGRFLLRQLDDEIINETVTPIFAVMVGENILSKFSDPRLAENYIRRDLLQLDEQPI